MASTSGEVCNAPEYVELQRQFDEFQAQSEEFERELEEDKRAVEAELVQTEQRLDAALKRAKRLDDELATAHEKTQRQVRGFNDMVEEVAGLKQANEALTGRVQTLEQANDNFEREVRALHASEEAALQKQEHAEEELILVKDELEEARRIGAEQAERRRRELQELQQELDRARAHATHVTTAHEKTQRQVRGFNDMVEEVAGLKQANEALTGRVQTLEQANDNFEREVRALHASEEAALQKQEHAEEELILVKDELEEARRIGAEQAERRRRELQELQQELDRARAHATHVTTVREKFEAATVAAETVAALRTLEAALRTLEVQFEYPRR